MRTPTPEEFQAYLTGQLSAPASARIDDWLEQCEDDPLADIDCDSDPLIRRLRKSGDGDEPFLAADHDGINVETPSVDLLATPTEEFPDSTWPEGLEAGARIDQFELGELLGRGGMGLVFLAHDTVIDRDVALKVLSVPEDTSGGAFDRFLIEARAVGKLNHTNVISILSAGSHHGRPWLAMELARGGSVRDRLTRGGPVPWQDATRILCDACNGLAAAHERGLVHRDVKPENLLFGDPDTVKVADFGLVFSPGTSADSADVPIAGTPHYMSPEQCCGRDADAQSDIYSLGASYFELLTGRRPFADARSPAAVLSAHLNTPTPDPRATLPELPDAVAEIVLCAMSKHPVDRFASCRKMQEALRDALNGGHGGTKTEKADRESAARAGHRPAGRWSVAAGGLIVAALAIAGARLPGLFSSDDDDRGEQESTQSTNDGRQEHVGATETIDQTQQTTTSRDRELAAHMLKLGGIVGVDFSSGDVLARSVDELPDGPVKVTWIDLTYCDGVDDSLLRRIVALPRVYGVYLRGTRVTDDGARLLGQIPLLSRVNLSETEITDDSIGAVGTLPTLRELQFTRTRVTNDALRSLQNSSLESLTANETSIDDEGLRFVARMNRLKLLCVRGTHVTDSGLRHLRTLTNLEHLNLAGTAVTNDGLVWLEEMSSLRKLVVSPPGAESNGLTQDGLDRLAAKLPQLRIKLLVPPSTEPSSDESSSRG